MNTFGKIAGATALAATMLAGTLAPSWAGALPVNSGAMQSQGTGQDTGVIQARWGGRGGWGPGLIVGGVAAGLAGAAIAGAYGPYGYGYGPSAYDYPAYGYAPYDGYYGYGPYWRRHWHRW